MRACERGESSVVLSLPAKLAARALPGTTTALLALVNRLLPRSDGAGRGQRRGRESESAWSPSPLTALGERSARAQNRRP